MDPVDAHQVRLAPGFRDENRRAPVTEVLRVVVARIRGTDRANSQDARHGGVADDPALLHTVLQDSAAKHE